MKNSLNTISFRKAVRIEHPEGIPLAKNYEDSGVAYGGNLILSYEPPVASLGTIGLGVVCRINKTTVSFAGTLESEQPGEPFVPSQDLINAVRDASKEMAVDIGETDNTTIAYVMEELLNYCVVNVPVRQVYETIRVLYPKEYRTLNLEYKRRYEQTIEADMDSLISKQQKSHRYGKAKSWIRIALKKDDIVTFDDDKFEKLRTENNAAWQKIKNILSEIKPIKNKYIVYNDPQNKAVKLIGRNAKNTNVLARTDGDIPIDFLEEFQEEEEDDLDWMDQEDQEYFGVEKKIDNVKIESFGVPTQVYTDPNVAKQYAKKIMQIHQQYINNGYKITDQNFVNLVKSLIHRKPQSKT